MVIRTVETEVDYSLMSDGIVPFLDHLEEFGISRVFDGAKPVRNDLWGVNQNVLDACEFALNRLNREGTMLVGIGPMASGKSSLVAELAVKWPKVNGGKVGIWKHSFETRGETENLWLQSWQYPDGVDTGLKTSKYQCLADLLAKDGINWTKGGIQIVDEVIFSGKGDPPQDNIDFIFDLLNQAKRHDSKLLMTGLHADFRGKLWPNMKWLLPLADLGVIEMQGRCDHQGCLKPSRLTMREVPIVKDGKMVASRPSHTGEKILRVGAVQGNQTDPAADFYHAMCERHHQVYSPAEAWAFDQQLGVDFKDYEGQH